jgi:hypothetical protein
LLVRGGRDRAGGADEGGTSFRQWCLDTLKPVVQALA